MLLESPTDPNAMVGVRRSAYRAVPTQLMAHGWDVDAIGLALRQSGARAAYLIPDHQNPTGLRRAAAPTREARGRACRARAGTVPIIDETFVELVRLDEPAVGAPGAPRGRLRLVAPETYTLGSVGQPWWGGLRLGWVALPAVPSNASSRRGTASTLARAVLEQLVVVDLRPPGRGPARRPAPRGTLPPRLPRPGPARHVPEWRFHRAGRRPQPLVRAARRPRRRPCAGGRVGWRAPGPGGQFGVEGGLGRFVRVPFCVAPDQADEVGRRLAEAWRLALGERATPAGHPPHRLTRMARPGGGPLMPRPGAAGHRTGEHGHPDRPRSGEGRVDDPPLGGRHARRPRTSRSTSSRSTSRTDGVAWSGWTCASPTTSDLRALAGELDLDQHAVEDAVTSGERPKATRHASHTFITVYATHLGR